MIKSWLAAPTFVIAILLEALEVDSVSSSLYVKLAADRSIHERRLVRLPDR